ncbi:MAG TPA: hypothetical protein VG710_04275 [Opitutus sp.]|nr:hypothetical protein [Opitutus sp.]
MSGQKTTRFRSLVRLIAFFGTPTAGTWARSTTGKSCRLPSSSKADVAAEPAVDDPAPLRPRIVSRLAALAALTGAITYLWLGWCAFPASNWNELRLAPTFALVHGETIYPPLDGGPLSTWIYGPVALLVNLPAALAASAATAVRIAGGINILVLVAPVAVICFGAAELKSRGWAGRMLALALPVLLLPATSAQFQVADHAAVALGLLSCFALARAPERNVFVAAALAVLAAGAKQTAIFLLPAQAAWLFATGARPAGRRYLLWCAALGGIFGAASGLAFGFRELWLNVVAIPARLPWGDAADKLARRAPQLAAQLTLPWLALPWLRRRGCWPDRRSETGRLLELVLYAAVAFVPIGLVSFFKIGGDVNVLHWSFYLVPVLAVAGVARAAPPPGVQLALVALVLLARVPDFLSLPARPQIAALQHAERVARANPRNIWFPYNPLVTFYSDRRLYHVEDGIATRHLAGFGLSETGFRRHLPPALAAVVYPAGSPDHFALQLLPEFNHRIPLGAWDVFTRPAK